MGATETVDLFVELINDDRREKAVELLSENAVMGISVPGSDERTNLRGRDKVGGWFVRAGDGQLAFAGLEMKPGVTADDDWEYFVLAAEKPEDPLQLVTMNGPLGVVVAAALEDRPQ